MKKHISKPQLGSLMCFYIFALEKRCRWRDTFLVIYLKEFIAAVFSISIISADRGYSNVLYL